MAKIHAGVASLRSATETLELAVEHGEPHESSEAPLAIPLTAEQAGALRTALAAQQKVWAAAEAAPADVKLYVDSNWNSESYPKGGAAMEAMLPFVDLVDCQYLITLGEAGGVVPRWQEVPECARINEKNVWRLRAWGQAYSCPVLCLSCAPFKRRRRMRRWLSPGR